MLLKNLYFNTYPILLISGAPLPKERKVTPATSGLNLKMREISVSAGQKFTSAVSDNMKNNTRTHTTHNI